MVPNSNVKEPCSESLPLASLAVTQPPSQEGTCAPGPAEPPPDVEGWVSGHTSLECWGGLAKVGVHTGSFWGALFNGFKARSFFSLQVQERIQASKNPA